MKEGGITPEFAFDVCLEVYEAAREVCGHHIPVASNFSEVRSGNDGAGKPGTRPRQSDYLADFAMAGEAALQRDRGRLRASRLILFRMYFLGGGQWRAVRALMGISELTWSDWVAEIKREVGNELMRRGVFPPGKYFREPSKR
jgi:hypothetical protein